MSDIANLVCRDLPKGWELQISLEKDAGWVTLFSPFGDAELFPTNGERLDEEILDALQWAIKQNESCEL